MTNEKNDLSKVIRDIQGGDKDAFHSLYSSWKNHAYHTAFVWTGDRTCAEDVMQETFVAVYKNINNLEHTEAFLSWFNQILARIAWRHNEKKNKAYALLIDSESAEFGTEFNDMRETSSDFLPEEYLENGEIRKAIMNGINGLPEAQKAAIVAFYLQHIPIATIAEMRKVSEGAIKNALHNGRRKLREMLEVSLGKGVLPAAFPIALVYDSINEIWSREMANSPVSAELSDLVFGSVLEDLGILGAEVSAEAVKTGSLLARIGSAACTLPVQIAGGLILVASVIGFTVDFYGERTLEWMIGREDAAIVHQISGQTDLYEDDIEVLLALISRHDGLLYEHSRSISLGGDGETELFVFRREGYLLNIGIWQGNEFRVNHAFGSAEQNRIAPHESTEWVIGD